MRLERVDRLVRRERAEERDPEDARGHAARFERCHGALGRMGLRTWLGAGSRIGQGKGRRASDSQRSMVPQGPERFVEAARLPTGRERGELDDLVGVARLETATKRAFDGLVGVGPVEGDQRRQNGAARAGPAALEDFEKQREYLVLLRAAGSLW